MTQDQIVVVLAAVFGYLQQFLRGFKWYNDRETFLFALGLGIVGAFWIAPANVTWQAITFSAVSLALTIVGATAATSAITKSVAIAPKFNEYAAPPANPPSGGIK